MAVVALSYCYPPLRYPRAIQVARLIAHLPDRAGVHVVGADEDTAKDPSLEQAYGAAAPVTRVPWSTRARALRKLRYRTIEDRMLVPDPNRPWVRDAVRATRRVLRPGDTLITFGQPMSDHVAGLKLARGARWIAHFSDPWVDSSFRHADRLTRARNARLERAVIERADAVVFTSDETVDLVMRKYPDAWRDRVHVVPHAFDPALYPDAPERGDGQIVLRYIGNFYGHRGPEPLLRAVEVARQRDSGLFDGVRIEFVGSAEHPVDAPDGLVRVRGPVDYVESLALMRSSDALLVLDAPADRSVFLPSKLIDYLGARRPILALTPPGAAANLVAETGGRVADPGDAEAGADAIAATIDAIRTGTAATAPDAVLARYEASRVAARFAALIDAEAGSTLLDPRS